METQFKLTEFNPRRKVRGAEAARVMIIEGDWKHELWMSKRDIARNMMVFGRNPEPVKAYEAYGA